MPVAPGLSVGRGLLFLIVAGTAWGTAGAAAALVFGAGDMGPISLSFWRCAGGFVLLLAARPRRPVGGTVPQHRRGHPGVLRLGPRPPPRHRA
ncbi:hypothetical protein ABZ369_39765, partial [Streptomyces sp. NPDC005918]